MMTKAKLKYLAKSKYLADVILENSDNPRRLLDAINNILHRIQFHHRLYQNSHQ